MTSHNPNDVQQRFCAHCHVFLDDVTLVFYCIYDHPIDYPRYYVVRRHLALVGATAPLPGQPELADTLDEARSFVPAGFTRLPCFPGDDATIIETWIL